MEFPCYSIPQRNVIKECNPRAAIERGGCSEDNVKHLKNQKKVEIRVCILKEEDVYYKIVSDA